MGGLALILFWSGETAAAASFANPIIAGGADPWIAWHDGYYYLTHTTGGDVRIRSATKLTGPNGIGAATPEIVFRPKGTHRSNVWAPELHFLQGKAYLYFAADDGTNANHRMFAAESVATGPDFSFVSKGKVFDATTDRWAIDGTVLEADDGALYFIWSGWPGAVDGLQNLYIAPMTNPWTISGSRVLLSTPGLAWESWIQEGPAVLKRNGKVFLVYAANRSWTDSECLGMLVNSDGNFLNPASWTKLPQPVFETVTGAGGSVYGPGHCSFMRSLDGSEDWIFYHAAKYSGAGWNRDIRMQRFSWTAAGCPDFGQPVPAGVTLAGPSGDGYTAARLESISRQAGGQVRVAARAPLPLLTNIWSIEASTHCGAWNALTNVPGRQFSAEVLDNATTSNKFYRVKSAR